MGKAWDIIAYTIEGSIVHADCMMDYKPRYEDAEFVPVFQSDHAELEANFCAVCEEGI